MLVVMKAQATEDQVRAVCQKIEKLGRFVNIMDVNNLKKGQ